MSSNEAHTVAELAVRAAGQPASVKTESGREFLVVPKDFQHQEITLPHSLEVKMPKAIEQSVTLQNADALKQYLNRFKGSNSIMFADIASSRIVGALDYHGPSQGALVKHKATLDLPYSEEWKIWSAVDNKLMPQLEFARFIEENAPDVKSPDAATLLEAARDLQARRNVNFIQAVRTDSDNENFEFTDNTEARTKDGLELPTKFVLSIPVYFGDPDVEVHAFLRWKLEDAKLLLGIKLHRAEHVRQAAFKLIVTDAMEKTSLLAVFGKLGS